MCFFLKILEEKTLPFGRTQNASILKFKHIELAIGGDIHSKALEGCTSTS